MTSNYKHNTTEKEGRALNIGFCASWADAIAMSICNSIQLLFGQDVHR